MSLSQQGVDNVTLFIHAEVTKHRKQLCLAADMYQITDPRAVLSLVPVSVNKTYIVDCQCHLKQTASTPLYIKFNLFLTHGIHKYFSNLKK